MEETGRVCDGKEGRNGDKGRGQRNAQRERRSVALVGGEGKREQVSGGR